MKILATGVNPTQCGHVPKMEYMSTSKEVGQCLRQHSCHFDNRPVVPGESLKDYDKIIIYLASLRGFLAVHALGVLWALASEPQKCVISFEDWQIPQALDGIKSARNDWDRIISQNPFGYKNVDKAAQYNVDFAKALESLTAAEWQWPVLLSVHKGGDISMFKLPKSKTFIFNPAPMMIGRYGLADHVGTSRSKRWVLAALHDHASWVKKQHVAWPVERFGVRKNAEERVREAEIFQRYTLATGVLSPAYKSCGSGWYRVRYGMAADALAVAAGDPAEMQMVSKEAYGKTPAQIEQLSEAELAELAMAQRDAYYKAAGTIDNMYDDVMAALNAI